MMAKQGLALEMIHFFSYPYLQRSQRKGTGAGGLLTGYCGRLTVNIVPFTAIQEELRRSCPSPTSPWPCAGLPMRISELVADRVGADAIVTGEPGPGGQPDHVGHGRDPGGGDKTRIPPGDRHGQGDRPDRPENHHLTPPSSPTRTAVPSLPPQAPRTHPKVSDFIEIEKNYDFEGPVQNRL